MRACAAAAGALGATAHSGLPPERLIEDLGRRAVLQVPGTAVFLTGEASGTPAALLHNLKHNKVVHERNVFLTLRTEQVPHVPEAERVTVEDLGHGFWRVVARYGFMEDPHVPSLLRGLAGQGLEIDPAQATYLLSRNTVLSRRKGLLGRWLDALFVFMARNAQVPTRFFRLPPNRVIEIGLQVEM